MKPPRIHKLRFVHDRVRRIAVVETVFGSHFAISFSPDTPLVEGLARESWRKNCHLWRRWDPEREQFV
jgi:hypothetical protein